MKKILLFAGLLLVTIGAAAQSLKCLVYQQTITYGGVAGSGSSTQTVLQIVALSDSIQLESLVRDTSALYAKLLLRKGDTLTISNYEHEGPVYQDYYYKKQVSVPPASFTASGHRRQLNNVDWTEIRYTQRGRTATLALPPREDRIIAMP